MKFFASKMRLIAPLLVMCCLFGASSQVAQAQTVSGRSLWLGNDTVGHVFQTTTTGTVITDLPGPDLTSTSLPTSGIAWDGTNLWFADPSGNFTKRTVDGKTVLDSFNIGPSGGEDLAWDSNRKVLWRILHNPAILQKIDPVAKTLITSYTIPNSDPDFLGTLGGLGIAYDSTRDRLYVSFCSAGCSSLAAGLVSIVDPNTLAPNTQSNLSTLFRTSGFATGGLAYDPSNDTLWVGDLTLVRNMDRSGNVLSSFNRPTNGNTGFVDGLEIQIQGTTTYTGDPNLANFTSGITTYAMFSNFSGGDVCTPGCPASFTPTSAGLAANGFRVFGGTLAGLPTTPTGQNWILATFPSAVSQIVVFPNIDHFGSGYDGYQYQIQGSNDLVNWTPLYDATAVSSAGEPFTLVSFTGTAPSTVNNVVCGDTPTSPNAGCPGNGKGPGGQVGYIAQFQFPAAYKYYAFGASTVAFAQLNPDQELSAVTSSFTTPPQTITQGQTNNIIFTDGNKIDQRVVIQSDANLGNTKSMKVRFIEYTPAVFNSTRLPGVAQNPNWSGGTTPIDPGTTGTPIPSANNNVVVMEQLCFSDAAGTTRIDCDIIAATGTKIALTSTYTGTSLPPNPGYFTADDGQNDWADITTPTDPACCSTSGGTNKINTDYFLGDKPPVITITFTPPTTTAYLLNQTVAANYTCTEPPSPPNPNPNPPPPTSCAGPVPNTSNIDTASVGSKTFTVSSTDAIGTTGTASVNYSVGYGICALYDQTKAVHSGATVPIKMYLCSSTGADVSNPGIVVHATGLFQMSTSTSDPVIDAGNSNPDMDFRFDSGQGPSGGYIFNLKTTGLGTGNWVIQFTVTGDPTPHSLGFGIK